MSVVNFHFKGCKKIAFISLTHLIIDLSPPGLGKTNIFIYVELVNECSRSILCIEKHLNHLNHHSNP